MGKIVKSGNITGERYVVAVPHASGIAREQHRSVDDDRFAASLSVAPSVSSPVSSPAVAQTQPAVDWITVVADAHAVIDRAAADASEMIVQAENAALDIVAQAEARAQTIAAEANVRGHGEGYAAGVEAGKAAADAEMREMIDAMHALMNALREERHALMRSAEPELVRLAVAIAERVVHQQIALDENVVVDNVRSALTRLISREVVTLRVNPADLETMRHHRDAIVAASDVEHLRIIEDQRVDRGGVVVETEAGTLDAKVSSQFREARRALRADDGIALGEQEVLHSSAQAS